MRFTIWGLLAIGMGTVALAADPTRTAAPKPPAGFPSFEVQEIAKDLKIGYAVILEDLNGDGKPDIIVVDQHRVVWYENPTWKMRTILQGKTRPDNVCITALDIDGNGDLELVLGAAWKPFDSKTPGTLQWLKRGKSLDDEWTMHPIPCDEPLVHRVRAMDLNGDGKPEIVMVPLIGREATAAANWMNGRPVRVMKYSVPKDPTKPENWKPEVLNDSYHVMHNFTAVNTKSSAFSILATSYEGVVQLTQAGDKWQGKIIGEGNQANLKSNRGASEIKGSIVGDKLDVIATIEPWHGNEVVVYLPPNSAESLWKRVMLDDHLRWGHAVSFADLDGDGHNELVIGVRDDPNPKLNDKFAEKRGVRIYKQSKTDPAKWERYLLENGGVAVEDLAVADLNGDGKPDIVAVGRATGNCRIYWNQGK